MKGKGFMGGQPRGSSVVLSPCSPPRLNSWPPPGERGHAGGQYEEEGVRPTTEEHMIQCDVQCDVQCDACFVNC
jgi:hypothetical protein